VKFVVYNKIDNERSSEMTKTIALVSCVSKKNEIPMPAEKLYCSDWFIKASAYAKQVTDEWYILSAKYGLLSPDKVIPPYNETLNNMSVMQRRTWGEKVTRDLKTVLTPGDSVIILAGDRYREHIIGHIRQMGCKVEIPMAGLKIGEQLGWLKSHLE
jgi:hypothetical protein